MWLLCCAAASAAGAADPESRVALVIGNAAYAQEPLRNPVNDARAMAKSLRALGFTVLLHEDATKKTKELPVLDDGRRIAGGGVSLFFYAGHGMQVRGRNDLVPVDARVDDEAMTRVAAVSSARCAAVRPGWPPTWTRRAARCSPMPPRPVR